jgi:hypothetical protein
MGKIDFFAAPVLPRTICLALERYYARFPPIGGVVAQLVERLVRNEKVRGSTPLGSTSLRPLPSVLGIYFLRVSFLKIDFPKFQSY